MKKIFNFIYLILYKFFSTISPCLRFCSIYITLFTRYTPLLRGLVYQYKFKKVGKRFFLEKSVSILGNNIEVGNQVAIRKDCILAGNGKLKIDNNTVINSSTIIGCYESIEIGKDVMIAPRCYILDVDHNYNNKELPISKQGYSFSPVKIEDGVWLGTQVVITKGVTIGKGSVVASNSVVTKDIPPFCVVAGVPAKIVKYF